MLGERVVLVQADVYRAVHSGTPPAALQDVSDNNIQAIIKACLIIDPAARPSANELLQVGSISGS
jgi:hypothetical protein